MPLTIQDICSEILAIPEGKTYNKADAQYVTKGLTRREPPKKEGLVQISPGQALSIIVERAYLNGTVKDYQRGLDVTNARKMARALLAGRDLGEVSLGLDGGQLYATDGQHRLVASVIARKPIWAVIRPMVKQDRQQRFRDQVHAKRLSADIITLSAQNKIADYVRAAIAAREAGDVHVWAPLVGMKTSSTVMGPSHAYKALAQYSTGVISGAALSVFDDERLNKAFKPAIGDELAQLYLTFGTKSTNPLAYRPIGLSAIAQAAVMIVAKTGRKESDIARWQKHMQQFDWAAYAWFRTSWELTDVLIRHWNKRLSTGRKIRV